MLLRPPPPPNARRVHAESAVTSAGVIKRVGGLPPVYREFAPHFLHATKRPRLPTQHVVEMYFHSKHQLNCPPSPPRQTNFIVF